MKKNKIGTFLLCLLIIIQPLLELYFFDVEGSIQIMGFNISTFFRFLLLGIICFVWLLNFKEIKYKRWFILYIVVSLIYLFFHILSNRDFVSYMPNGFDYNIIEECLYYIRMLAPMILLYTSLTSKMTFKSLIKTIYITTLIICLMLIITNVFKISFSSYLDVKIYGNFFDWFISKGQYGYLYTTTRGFFRNIIITYLLLLFLPIIYYDYFNSCKLSKYFVLLMIMISLLMVGTKSTSYGFIIISICEVLLYIFAVIKGDYKYNAKIFSSLILIIMLFFIILDYSPVKQRMLVDKFLEEQKVELVENQPEKTITIKNDIDVNNENNTEQSLSLEEALSLVESEDEKRKLKIDYLDIYHEQLGFSIHIIEDDYPYQYDPDFWIDMVNNSYLYQRSNNRFVIKNIYNRIFEVNTNKSESLFGIGFSRTSKMYTLERDFIYQYYSLGILGLLIFLGPYIYLLIFAGIYMLIGLKKRLTLKNLSFMLSIGFLLVVAYYSGNTIEHLGITIPLGIICGFFLKELIKKEAINGSKDK